MNLEDVFFYKNEGVAGFNLYRKPVTVLITVLKARFVRQSVLANELSSFSECS
jgi:hypothetical protein